MGMFKLLFAGILAGLTCAAPASCEPPALPALHADPGGVSVSGLSSGGYMALQYSVTYSSEIVGAGIVAGGPFNCAGIYLGAFLTTCMSGKPSGATSWRSASDFAANAVIDKVANIRRQRIYLFHGTKDSVVGGNVMDAARDFYRAAGVAPANLVYEDRMPAGHAFISDQIGNPDCGANGGDYIDRCAVAGTPYDQPGAILRHIYGSLQSPAGPLSGAPEPFDQSRYAQPSAAMARTGYVYIPASCRSGSVRCRVHVVFHGCLQSATKVGDHVYARLGYNGWADANNLIILYPQVDATSVPYNPNGCWDWWGYTSVGWWGFSGSTFLFRDGPQMNAIHAMIARLESAP